MSTKLQKIILISVRILEKQSIVQSPRVPKVRVEARVRVCFEARVRVKVSTTVRIKNYLLLNPTLTLAKALT